MSDPDTKTMDMTGQKARYIKYVVKKSVGGFFSAAELQPYKVDGTEGYIVGDKMCIRDRLSIDQNSAYFVLRSE